MSEMIDIKKTYKTRDGLEVEILTTTAKGLYNGPVVGLITGYNSPQVWSATGSYDRDKRASSSDLIEVKPVREGWMNIYATLDGAIYSLKTSKEQADAHACGMKRIACIKIQFTEGEGLNDNQTGR